MTLVDGGVHYEHVQVFRCNIKPESAQKCKDVENEPISFFVYFLLRVK
jgi:hypothetical protein